MHIGVSTTSCHYQTYARHEGAPVDRWLHDDELRSVVLRKELETSREEKSYICFYERIENANASGVSGSAPAKRNFESVTSEEGLREITFPFSKRTRWNTNIDAQSVYGYRPQHPDTWFLSPWEFRQWFKPVELKRPSSNFPYSKWTASGKSKMKEQNPESMVAGED